MKDLTYENRVAMETLIRQHWPSGKNFKWQELARLKQRTWRSVKNEYRR